MKAYWSKWWSLRCHLVALVGSRSGTLEPWLQLWRRWRERCSQRAFPLLDRRDGKWAREGVLACAHRVVGGIGRGTVVQLRGWGMEESGGCECFASVHWSSRKWSNWIAFMNWTSGLTWAERRRRWRVTAGNQLFSQSVYFPEIQCKYCSSQLNCRQPGLTIGKT